VKFAVTLAVLLAALPAAAAESDTPAAPLVLCAGAPALDGPPPPTEAALPAPTGPSPCPAGHVPQPIGRHGLKGMPRVELHGVGVMATAPQDDLYYFYAAAFQPGDATGAQAGFTQDRPYVDPADYHSLAELVGQSADGRNMIEIGWTVDPGLNHDRQPHLFVFHWVDGRPTCYNGCGYVQVSKTRYPGMPVELSQRPNRYALRFDGRRWWVGYQGEWIGFFPASLWSGSFTSIGLAQWFGEVAASSPAPCTQMGNGKFGTGLSAAAVASEKLGSDAAAALPGEITDPALYAVGSFSGTGYRFGGPGAC
jgi:hypothetical protein